MKKAFIIFSTILTIGGCSSNHIVADGVCLTCFNNPLTGESINYDKSEYSNDAKGKSENFAGPHSTPGFSISPVNRKNFYYHWVARSEEPHSYIEFLANKYFSNYRAANEFEKKRIYKQIEPEIISRIEMAKEASELFYIHNVRLYEYDFTNKSFMISVPTFTPLSIDVFGKPSRDTEIRYEIERHKKVNVSVKPDVAEEAIKAAGGGRRWAESKIYFEISAISEKCEKSCFISVKPSKIELANYITKAVIGATKI